MEISKKLTSKESFAILHEIESRKYPGGIKFSDWQEQKEKAKLDAIKNLVPEVGLIEYRLTDINFHTEASLLHAGEYEKVIEIIKTW